MEQLLEDPGAAAEAGHRDLLALAGHEVGALLAVLGAAEDEEAALVPEVVAAEGGRVRQLLRLPLAAAVGLGLVLLVVVVLVPPPDEPRARAEVGVDHEAAGALGEALVGHPGHQHVVGSSSVRTSTVDMKCVSSSLQKYSLK